MQFKSLGLFKCTSKTPGAGYDMMEFLVGGAACWSLGWRFMGGMVVRACVRGFSGGLEEALSLSLSEMVGFRDVGVCILGAWRREWSIPVCAIRYMVRRRAL